MIEQYIHDFGRDIYSFCVYLTGSRDLADDLYQQTFLVAIEKGDIDPDQNPKSYLLSIAINLWNNQRRKIFWRWKKVQSVDDDEQDIVASVPDERPNAEEDIIRKERDRLIRKLVSELPEKHKQVIILFYTEELKIEQIAKILNISEGTVKSRLHKARKTLKERLARYE